MPCLQLRVFSLFRSPLPSALLVLVALTGGAVVVTGGARMGVLLVLGVCVLAFLCGRLQVTVNALAKRVEQLELDSASFERFGKFRVMDGE